MSQQRSKKGATPWIHCENCSTSLLVKDVDLHTTDCPPNLGTPMYNFVKESVFYGVVELKSNEDIKHISSKDTDNLVFLSQSAIQLCGLSIGDWAVVQVIDNTFPPVARVVWPTVEKALTSILFTKNGLDLTFLEAHKTAKVSKIPTNICSAKCITLVISNSPRSLEITSDLCTRISKSHKNRILTLENMISIMFYGKLLKFEVKSIAASDSNEINLENDFSRMCIADKKYEFYVVDENTKWKLYRDQVQYESEVLDENKKNTVAGLDEEMENIRELMNACLTVPKSVCFPQSRSVLLFGNSGTGKTTLANQLAQESNATVISICTPDLYSKNGTSADMAITELFQDAIDHMPSVVIMDEIDILCPSRTSRLTDAEKRIVSKILLMFDNLHLLKDGRVFVIATTNKPDNIDPAFRRCGRLDREIEIPTPSPKSRKDILLKLLANLPQNVSEDELQEIAMNTHGYVGADLVSLCSRASLNASRRADNIINIRDLKFSLKIVGPSAMRDVQVEVPNVKWCDIGGQEDLKLKLRQSVEWPLKYSDSFLRLGINPPRGVLMFGPPGCSKTMIAKALATESGLNFLSIKGPELFSKWVGESERAVREVFRKARQVAPSIVFFDEIDALGGERSSGSSTSVQERVLAQLLTELDGVSPLGDVTILAATNRPDKIDKALLRPGRLDRIVYVPLPDSTTRREIFRIKLSQMPVPEVKLDDLVEKTRGYSGAEVIAVCHEAAMKALEEDITVWQVAHRHFDEALALVTPRTPPALIKMYDDYLQIKI